jgi:uncharacterized protein (TIGR02246 family)
MQTATSTEIPTVTAFGISTDTHEFSNSTSTQDSNSEIAIHQCYEQLMDGWNIGSAEAFAATFAEDGHLVGFDGTHLEGRQAITEFQRPLFEKWLKGTRLVGEVTNIQFLTADLAVVHAIGGTIMRGQTKPDPARDSIQTLIMIQREGSWQVLAFQNTRLRPMGQSTGSVIAWLLADGLWNWLRPKKQTAQSRKW